MARIEFQFLIGKVKTEKKESRGKIKLKFQFLIGKVKTNKS